MLTQINVPTRDSAGDPIPQNTVQYWIEQTERLACTIGGGYSTWSAVGGWLDDTGQLHREPVHIVQTTCQGTSEHYRLVAAHCEAMATDLGQLSTYANIDGAGHLYEPQTV